MTIELSRTWKAESRIGDSAARSFEQFVWVLLVTSALALVSREILFSYEILKRSLLHEYVVVAILAVAFAVGIDDYRAQAHSTRRNRRLLLAVAVQPVALLIVYAIDDPYSGLIAGGLLVSLAAVMSFSRSLLRRTSRRIALIDCSLDAELKDSLADCVELIREPSNADADSYALLLAQAEAARDPQWASFISRAAISGCPTSSADDFHERLTGRVRLDGHCDRRLFGRRRSPARAYQFFRSAADVGISLVALVLLSPLFLVVALAILITMGRPILFSQERVGLNGRVFRMHKFRTMVTCSDASAAATATAKQDKRVTRLGWFLRRTHIDELPQFWNLLVGEMTLIGPRPEQTPLVAHYRATISEYDLRHLIRPGLTGWAQVQFGYAATESETRHKLEYDLFYVHNRGLWLDLKIVAYTLLVLFDPRHVR